ncbi:alpha/beta hydrolase family protein [Zavarzinella formosa]|uniref:alpha/beta hydrolase family protein n=1 Tax=Zavarzinella formosa TaxID=360055 RepID=UPI0002F776B6|nr:hypothetical protein [Zavarzinella formosa]
MFRAALLIPVLCAAPVFADQLFGTEPLTEKGDLAAKMVAGIDKYLMRELEKAQAEQASKPFPKETRLREILGIKEWPSDIHGEVIVPLGKPAALGETDKYTITAVRWRVIHGITGEGLWLEPKKEAVAQVVAIPDAGQTPEDICGLTDAVSPEKQFARLLVEQNIRVIVPTLISRETTLSNSDAAKRVTTQPHREFLYRMGYEMGRHLIGYEVQRAIAAVDLLYSKKSDLPCGVIGNGEGGVIALYLAALDSRFQTVASIGYAGPLPSMWQEPIDRNVWAVVKEFGLAGLGELIYPKSICIGYNNDLIIKGRVPNSGTGLGTTPGNIVPLSKDHFANEWKELESRYNRLEGKIIKGAKLSLVDCGMADPKSTDPKIAEKGMQSVIENLMQRMGIAQTFVAPGKPNFPKNAALRHMEAEDRQKRLFTQIRDHVQAEWRASEPTRWERFANLDYKSRNGYVASIEPVRKYFDEEVIGKLPAPTEKPNPKAREIYDTPKWKGYEVKLDLYSDVFAYGILLLPKDMKPLEKRPVVVCQHGLEGRPTDVCDPTKKTPYYNSFGAQLADLGYIVFAPQNPYIGRDDFRVLQRKANPLKLSLFSFIVRQHERILDWLPTIPHVDGNNIGFYGLSYGGKTAVRVPAILTKYKYSICSGDFNEWIGKNVSMLYPNSYMFTGEYEMYEFNLGKTFNYAEMAYLIAPRPFMVERGHDDGVGSDEMVSYEYAKVRYHYAKRLGIGDRTEIEYFVGGHEIRGIGTFEFIKKHSGWPATK